eukprot:10005055-Heterocapsa_arctica.AAC.1
MDTANIGTMGQLLRMETGPAMSLDLFLYIRSPAVVTALEAVKLDGRALSHVSEELKGDTELVMAAVKQN